MYVTPIDNIVIVFCFLMHHSAEESESYKQIALSFGERERERETIAHSVMWSQIKPKGVAMNMNKE